MSDFAEFHDELRTVARAVLAGATPLVHHGEPSPPLAWDDLTRTGWLGLEVAEEFGGAGVTFAETAVVLEELGRAAATTGYVATAVLGVAALNATTGGGTRDGLLRSIATGTARVAVALEPDPTGPGWATTPFTIESGRLTGACEYVLDAAEADVLLLPTATSTGEPVLVVLDVSRTGLVVEPVELVDRSRRVATVRATDVLVDDLDMIPFVDPGRALQRLSDRAAVAIACDSLGLAESMLAATVTYAGQRFQFDQPIGSFQAVKHACADMLVQITIGRELLEAAVDAMTSGDATIETAMAKSYLGTMAVDVVGKAMQLHGGIGYTWESGVHVYLKRAVLDRQLFGRPGAHRRTLADRFIASAR